MSNFSNLWKTAQQMIYWAVFLRKGLKEVTKLASRKTSKTNINIENTENTKDVEDIKDEQKIIGVDVDTPKVKESSEI